MIPENPETLEESLKIFETISYKANGFPIVFLDYNYRFNYWQVVFRNPVNFKNPDIKEDTPLKAVHKMLDFLRELQRKRNNEMQYK